MVAWPTAHCKTPLADQRVGKGSKRQQTFFFFHRENYCNSWVYQVAAARKGETSLTFFPLQQLPHTHFPASSCPLLTPNGAHHTGIPMTHPLSLSLPCQWNERGCRQGMRSGVLSQKKWQKNAPETGRRGQQGFLAITHWDLPNSVKSPHAILTYLELLKLLEYKLSFKERTTWESLCVTFCIGGMFQNHTEENAFSKDYSTAGVQKNYSSEKEYRKSPYSPEM